LVIGFIEHLQNVTTNNYTAIANSHSLPFISLLYLHRLSPGNGFQRRSFLSFHGHILTSRRLSYNSLIAPTDQFPGWRPSHTNLLLFSLPSQDSRNRNRSPLYSFGTDRTENIASSSSSIAASRGYRTDCIENTFPFLLYTAIT
jgi:hypothetical protein